MSLYLFSDWSFTIDVPGPNKFEFSSKTARRRVKRGAENPIPVATGLVFAGIPYVIGAAIVYFGPAPMKPVGASMLVPGPSDIPLFYAGYRVGERIEEPLYEGIRERVSVPKFQGIRFDPRHYYM